MIHWGKVVDPTPRITFLGTVLDSVSMTLSLPEEKVLLLKQELQSSLRKNQFTKRQLQSLAGRLSWAASVVKGGRVFLRRIFNTIRVLRHNAHRVRISSEMRKDLLWWANFMDTFNGRSTLLDQRPIECIFTDACNEGAGGFFGQDWFYFNWSQDWPQAALFHINEKEIIAVALAAYRWAPFWRNKHIIIYSDNSVTVSALNKGTCRNDEIMRCIRSLFWLSASFNFYLTARYLPGVRNVAADSASRLSTPGYLEALWQFTDNSPCICTCPQKRSFFCLTDSQTGDSLMASGVIRQPRSLTASLDEEVLYYRANSFSALTSKTYSTQRSAFLKFCSEMGIQPVPLSQGDLGHYVAFLSRRLCFNSVRQYLNIVRLMHLEAGLQNPLEKNWYVASILKGVRRVKGDTSIQKLPITPVILMQILLILNLQSAFDRTFWATCLVGFFSFFRKSNLLVHSHLEFDPQRSLCANDVRFTLDGAILTVRWSKVIQFQERVLLIPLPKIANSPLCPSTALLRLTLENPPCAHPVPLFRYNLAGANNVPLNKLQACRGKIGVDSSKYSGHSLRRGGASFALQCGSPTDLIKIQGDWRSDAVERYLEPAFEMQQQVARQMGASVGTLSSS